MVPTWVLSTLIIIAGCILAMYVGSSLPDYDFYGWYILGLALLFTIAAVTNDFAMLMAVGVWMPVPLPVAGFKAMPTVAIVMAWIALMLFFRLCRLGTVRYVRSFNLLFLVIFAWVPIRFLMNPVYKLGASVEGGSGVSGAMPYFLYVLAAGVLIILGGILNTREKLVHFMRWSFGFVLFLGFAFLICAFTPASAPYLYSMGIFAAGGMGDGITRIVELPAYGFFLVQAAFCPNLFKLKPWHSAVLMFFGAGMMIVGGNRSAIISMVVALPVILILRRSTHVLALMTGLGVIAIAMLHFSVDQAQSGEISPLVRSLGVFDSKIDKASGGDASAEWRYEIWQSGINKIMENPLAGKGFGNLPKHLELKSDEIAQSTDFEIILAGGEAHNGFVTAAYGFGIPFMAALAVGLILRFFSLIRSALLVDRHDRELRDLYAFIASMFPAYFVNVYTAFDLSVTGLWLYVGMSFILDNLPKTSPIVDTAPAASPNVNAQNPQLYGGTSWAYSGAKFNAKRK